MGESRRTAVPALTAANLPAAITRIQWLTVTWMSVEVALALFGAVRARSVALAAFGGDSGIELLSAATVLWRFRSSRVTAEKTATRVRGWLLIARGRELPLFHVAHVYLQNASVNAADCDVHLEISATADRTAPRVLVETSVAAASRKDLVQYVRTFDAMFADI